MENGSLKYNGTRAKIVIIALWVMAALELVGLFSSYMQYKLLTDMRDIGVWEDSDVDANDLREVIVATIYIVGFLITAIFFIMWFRRAYSNLHKRVDQLRFEPGWAAGAWFVPILNFFRPYQIMMELYTEGRNYLRENQVIIKSNFSTFTVAVWWILWAVNSMVEQVAFRMSRNAESLDELINVTSVSMVSFIMGVPVAFLAIKVVKDYSKVESLIYNLCI